MLSLHAPADNKLATVIQSCAKETSQFESVTVECDRGVQSFHGHDGLTSLTLTHSLLTSSILYFFLPPRPGWKEGRQLRAPPVLQDNRFKN